MAVRADPEVVAQKLDERGWRLADLASAAGISIPTAWRVVRGEPVSIRSRNKVAAAFVRHRPKAALLELLPKASAS